MLVGRVEQARADARKDGPEDEERPVVAGPRNEPAGCARRKDDAEHEGEDVDARLGRRVEAGRLLQEGDVERGDESRTGSARSSCLSERPLTEGRGKRTNEKGRQVVRRDEEDEHGEEGGEGSSDLREDRARQLQFLERNESELRNAPACDR